MSVVKVDYHKLTLHRIETTGNFDAYIQFDQDVEIHKILAKKPAAGTLTVKGNMFPSTTGSQEVLFAGLNMAAADTDGFYDGSPSVWPAGALLHVESAGVGGSHEVQIAVRGITKYR